MDSADQGLLLRRKGLISEIIAAMLLLCDAVAQAYRRGLRGKYGISMA